MGSDRAREDVVREGAGGRADEPRDPEAAIHQGVERLAHAQAPAERGVVALVLDHPEVVRHLDAGAVAAPGVREGGQAVVRQGIGHRQLGVARLLGVEARRVTELRRQLPADHEAVGGEGAVERAPRDAVHVVHVLHGARAEPVDFEVRVAGDQGVGGPEHDLDPERLHLLPLVVLEPVADVAPARLLADRQHVRPVRRLPLADPGEAEDEPDHAAVAIEGAGGHPADLLRHAQDRRRDALRESAPPGLLLDLAALDIFLERAQVADRDVVERIVHAGAGGSVKSWRFLSHGTRRDARMPVAQYGIVYN
ncbi:MAG: hypothetical protein ACLGIK_07420, partial [Gemmatimonadota bacterium]